MFASVLGLAAEDWTAVAACVAAGTALVAGGLAIWQLIEARSTRLQQAQPYVVIYAVESAVGAYVVDLVVRNFGTTAASDVTIAVTPELQRAAGGKRGESEAITLPEVIPTLAPGQEWRGFWDTTIARHEAELPDRYDAIVRFNDSSGREHTTRSILDWRVLVDRELVNAYGAHHAAKALQEIQKTIKQWSEGVSGGLKVYSRDGDARDERRRQEWEERRRVAEQDASEGE